MVFPAQSNTELFRDLYSDSALLHKRSYENKNCSTACVNQHSLSCSLCNGNFKATVRLQSNPSYKSCEVSEFQ